MKLPATQKLVALSLADQANDEGVCWPSVNSLSARCGFSERSVYGTLEALESVGFMTVERRSGRPNVYRLVPQEASGKLKKRRRTPERGAVVPLHEVQGSSEETDDQIDCEPLNVVQGLSCQTPESGAGVTPERDSPLNDVHPCTSFRGPLNVVQGTPERGAGGISTVIETSRTINKTYKPPRVAERPIDVDEKVWSDFLELRKSKRAPLTETALDGIRAESDRAGQTLNATLRLCCNRGWQGFNADWLRDRHQQRPLTDQDIAEALAEGDRRRAQEAHR